MIYFWICINLSENSHYRDFSRSRKRKIHMYRERTPKCRKYPLGRAKSLRSRTNPVEAQGQYVKTFLDSVQDDFRKLDKPKIISKPIHQKVEKRSKKSQWEHRIRHPLSGQRWRDSPTRRPRLECGSNEYLMR